MYQSEESPQQQYIPGGAGQMANTLPPFYDTPDAVATSYNVSVPVFSTMPPPLVSTTQQQLTYQEAQAQHLQHVRERLRLFWANQMQEMKPDDLKKHNLPLAPIKRIMKADKDVRMIAKETAAVFDKACEMFILDLTSQAWINTEGDGRRIVQNKDIAAAIYKTDLYDFLEQVIPRDQFKEQNLKTTIASQHVGSSTKSTIPRNNVPQPHGVGLSRGTSAGGQQPPPPFMPLYQSGPQNQHSFVAGPQAQYQHNQRQPSMPWPQAEFQQQSSMPWPRAQYEQQPSIPWPQAQQHTPEQLPMPWLQDELIPDQQYLGQAFLSWPQDLQIPDQQQNDN